MRARPTASCDAEHLGTGQRNYHGCRMVCLYTLFDMSMQGWVTDSGGAPATWRQLFAVDYSCDDEEAGTSDLKERLESTRKGDAYMLAG